MSESLKVRREPKQIRSRQLVARILETTHRIVVEEGIEALTTNRIADESGLSIGSIYQYFRNKDDIVDAMLERHIERVEREIMQMVQKTRDLSEHEMARLVIGQFVRNVVSQQNVFRSVLARTRSSRAGRRVTQPEALVLDRIRSMTHTLHLPIRHRNSDAALRMALNCLSAMTNGYVNGAYATISVEEFTELLTDLVVRFLYEDEPGAGVSLPPA